MLNTGIFPSELLISKVLPLYKANDKTLLSIYTPIALLPSLRRSVKNRAHKSICKQDAREAMRVVFFCTSKCICMHKTKFLMNIFKYCFKSYIKLHEFTNCNSANYDV